jgi:hypothetical protein
VRVGGRRSHQLHPAPGRGRRARCGLRPRYPSTTGLFLLPRRSVIFGVSGGGCLAGHHGSDSPGALEWPVARGHGALARGPGTVRVVIRDASQPANAPPARVATPSFSSSIPVRREPGCLCYHLFEQADYSNACVLVAGWAVAAHPAYLGIPSVFPLASPWEILPTRHEREPSLASLSKPMSHLLSVSRLVSVALPRL